MDDQKIKKLNVGVIGAGWWATSAHIPGILSHPDACLKVVQSRNIDKAKKIAKDFGAEKAFDSYQELIDQGDVDAVVVSSTPNMHYQEAKYALEKGKHILLEKPMTFTAGEARELCDIANENRLHLLVSCPWHYTPHGKNAKQLISDGVLGNIKMISILMTNPIDKLLKGINTTPTHGLNDVYVSPNKGSYNDPRIAGGGQIYGQVSHVGAYLAYLLGVGPAEVYAKFDYDGSVNDIYDSIMITMGNGTLVSLASTGATPLEIRNFEIRIFGTKAIMLMDLWNGNMELYSFMGDHKKFLPLDRSQIYPDQAPVRNLIDVCLGLGENLSPGILGYQAMKIIEASTQSNKNQKPIIISDL